MAAEGTLFAENDVWEEDWKAREAVLKQQWIDTLAERITTGLAKGEALRIIDRPAEILGEDLVGVVRTLHLRAALKKVPADGNTLTDPKGQNDLLNLRIKPA